MVADEEKQVVIRQMEASGLKPTVDPIKRLGDVTTTFPKCHIAPSVRAGQAEPRQHRI